jgi:hypothetical protein
MFHKRKKYSLFPTIDTGYLKIVVMEKETHLLNRETRAKTVNHRKRKRDASSSINASGLYSGAAGSTFGRDSDYHDFGLLWFYSVLPGKCRDGTSN